MTTDLDRTRVDDPIFQHVGPALEIVLPDLIEDLHTLALAMRGAVATGAIGC